MVRRLLVVVVLVVLGGPALPGVALAQKHAVILRTEGGGPYQEAAAGFQAAWEDADEIVVNAGSSERLAERVRSMNPDVVFGIGPAAADFSKRFLGNVPSVYAFAGTEAPKPNSKKAVVLDIEVPAAHQMALIKKSITDPNLRRRDRPVRGKGKVGVLYNPALSQDRIDALRAAAEAQDLELIAIPVERERDVRRSFDQAAGGIDAFLFIPDATVSTAGSVAELLRRCLVKGIPAVGYTPWFAQNGAVLAVSADYRGLGQEAATHATSILAGGAATEVAPQSVIATYNVKVARKLGILLDFDFDDPSVRVIE